jgi:deoxyribose-phosphate aldolase
MSPAIDSAIPISLNTWSSVARLIDHTLLKPETIAAQVGRLCQEAVQYGFPTVFVHPSYVGLAAKILRGTGVKVGTPIGFPQGATLSSVKRFEAVEVLREGAGELDMVLNVGALKSGYRDLVEADIRGVVEVAHGGGALLKVILETTLLTLEEKILAGELAIVAGADFLKTSTGLVGGATVEDVRLLRSVAGTRARVKASGGIRTVGDLFAMVAAGADRIGTSAGVEILRGMGAPEMSGKSL